MIQKCSIIQGITLGIWDIILEMTWFGGWKVKAKVT